MNASHLSPVQNCKLNSSLPYDWTDELCDKSYADCTIHACINKPLLVSKAYSCIPNFVQ